MVWPAIIGAVGGLASGFLNKRSNDETRDDMNYWNREKQRLAEDQWAWQQRRIQETVADAEKAGIHKLYALGSAGAASPSFSTSHHAPSGSALGEGIRTAANAVSRAMPTKADPLDALRGELLTAQTNAVQARGARDFAEAQFIDSKRAREEQEVNPGGAARTFALPKAEAVRRMKLLGHSQALGPHASAEDVEEQYGDIVGSVHGLGRYSRDSMAEQMKKTPRFKNRLDSTLKRWYGKRKKRWQEFNKRYLK